MTYELEYINPSHVNVRVKVDTFRSLPTLRAWVRKARQYPGSFELISVTKVTPKGVRTPVEL